MAGCAYTVIKDGEPVYWTDDRAKALEVSQKRGGVVQDHKTASAWNKLFS